MTSIITGIVVLTLILCITFGAIITDEDTHDALKEMWNKRLDTKREIEFRRLEVIEKTPELRQLVFHPKIITQK